MRPRIYYTHVIIGYDSCNAKNCSKFNSILRKYCYQQQASLFEGELTDAQLKRMILELKKVIDKNGDNLIIWRVGKGTVLNKVVMGKLRWRVQRVF